MQPSEDKSRARRTLPIPTRVLSPDPLCPPLGLYVDGRQTVFGYARGEPALLAASPENVWRNRWLGLVAVSGR
jgi:hypothetical protein